MTVITQLEKRACEITVEALQGAMAEAEFGCDKNLRLRLAQIWEKYPDDLEDLFQAIYLDSLLARITGTTDSDVAAAITDFPAIADCTQNPFMAPLLVFAARSLNWESIVGDCVDLFFSDKLMGNFGCPGDAVAEFGV